jgi:hypothetical protein
MSDTTRRAAEYKCVIARLVHVDNGNGAILTGWCAGFKRLPAHEAFEAAKASNTSEQAIVTLGQLASAACLALESMRGWMGESEYSDSTTSSVVVVCCVAP